MKTCFLFPGQGAQYPGMAKDLWENSEEVKNIFKLASNISGKDMSALLFEGSEDDLKATDNTQLAITLANVSASMFLKEKGITPDGCAGFSLGEYSALWESGILTTENLFALVKVRGEIMEAASRKLDSPDGNPGMAAVVGIGYDEVVEAAESIDDLYIANYNSPIQIVIAGTHAAIDKAEAVMDEAGAMKYVKLKVSGPFHSPLMEEAKTMFTSEVNKIAFNDPKLPVFSNVSGEIIKAGSDAQKLCIRQIVSSVLWVKEEQTILDLNYERILEVGPGMVLRGLWRSFNKQLKCQPAGKVENIEKLLEQA